VRAFLRQRLGIRTRRYGDDVSDSLSVELDHLERWDVGEHLLQARLRGADRRAACLAEINRGLLPPGMLGRRIIEQVEPMADALATVALDHIGARERRDPLDVQVALPDGRLLTGTVPAPHGDTLLNVSYSRLGYKHRLAAWVALVAACAAHPERELQSVRIGRGRGDDVRTAIATLPAGSPSERGALALREIERLVTLFDLGMREPLPLFCKTSGAYAWAARQGQDPYDDACSEWKSDFTKGGEWFSREDEEAEHQLVLSGTVALQTLLDHAPSPAEEGDGWAADETSRLGRLARYLWDGLLANEQVSSR